MELSVTRNHLSVTMVVTVTTVQLRSVKHNMKTDSWCLFITDVLTDDDGAIIVAKLFAMSPLNLIHFHQIRE